MAIKSNLSSGVIDLASGDNTVLNNTADDRWNVLQIKLHADTAVGDTITLFNSPNTTSASGTRIDRIVMAGDDTQSSKFVTTNLAAGEYLIANALTGSLVNIEAIYTERSGDS